MIGQKTSTMRSGPDVRKRMLAHAANIAANPRSKAKPQKWPPNCPRCGFEVQWRGKYWKCKRCELDGGEAE